MKNFRIIISGLGGILILIIAIPLARVIVTADPGRLRSTRRHMEVVHSVPLTRRAALFATLACLLFGIPLSYALARWDFRATTVAQCIIDLPVMIPHSAAGIALLTVY